MKIFEAVIDRIGCLLIIIIAVIVVWLGISLIIGVDFKLWPQLCGCSVLLVVIKLTWSFIEFYKKQGF